MPWSGGSHGFTLRMMGRAAAWGFALLAGLFPLAALALLIRLQAPEALLTLPPADLAILMTGLFLPPCLMLLILAWLAQRKELAALNTALLHQAAAFEASRLAAEALTEERRTQTALLQEQVSLTVSALAVGQRQVEALQTLSGETRLQRLVAEWNITVAELGGILAAMWRLEHGWKTPGPGGQDLPLPPIEELPLRILRLLPPTAQEMAQYEVDERFVRQAARYRATFRAFLDRVPDTGPLSRSLFRDMVYGRLDARLATLPRPDHSQVIDPATLAAE